MEEKIRLGGLVLRLIDTAGIRESRDQVERLGVERSRRAMAEAGLILALVDSSLPPTGEDAALLEEVSRAGVPWVLIRSSTSPTTAFSSTVSRVVPGTSVTMARS